MTKGEERAYEELNIPEGCAKAFFEALTAMNDRTAPGKQEEPAAKTEKDVK